MDCYSNQTQLDVASTVVDQWYKQVERECIRCRRKNNLRKCGKCTKVYYCSENCQKEDWKDHQYFCFRDQGIDELRNTLHISDKFRAKMVQRNLAPRVYDTNYMKTVEMSKDREGTYCTFFPLYPLQTKLTPQQISCVDNAIPVFDRLMRMGYFLSYYKRGKKFFVPVFMELWRNGVIINPWTETRTKLTKNQLISFKRTMKLFPIFLKEMGMARKQGGEVICAIGAGATGAGLLMSNFLSPTTIIGLGLLGSSTGYLLYAFWESIAAKTKKLIMAKTVSEGVTKVASVIKETVAAVKKVVEEQFRDQVAIEIVKWISWMFVGIVLYRLLLKGIIDRMMLNIYLESQGCGTLPDMTKQQGSGSKALLVVLLLVLCGVGVEKASRHYRTISNVISDTEEFFTPTSMKTFVNTAMQLLGKNPPFNTPDMEYRAKLIKFTDFLDVVNLTMTPTPDQYERLRDMTSWIELNSMTIKELGLNMQFERVLRKSKQLLENRVRKVPNRRRPLNVLLAGASNQGKSYLSHLLAGELLQNSLGVTEDLEDHIYYVSGSSTFKWENYDPAKHLVVIWDDFLQSRDASMNGKTLEELYRILEDQVVALEQAFDKGKVYFGSRVVIFSTNNANLDNSGIMSVEAFYKRIDYSYKVTRNGVGKSAFSFEPLQQANRFKPQKVSGYEELLTLLKKRFDDIAVGMKVSELMNVRTTGIGRLRAQVRAFLNEPSVSLLKSLLNRDRIDVLSALSVVDNATETFCTYVEKVVFDNADSFDDYTIAKIPALLDYWRTAKVDSTGLTIRRFLQEPDYPSLQELLAMDREKVIMSMTLHSLDLKNLLDNMKLFEESCTPEEVKTIAGYEAQKQAFTQIRVDEGSAVHLSLQLTGKEKRLLLLISQGKEPSPSYTELEIQLAKRIVEFFGADKISQKIRDSVVACQEGLVCKFSLPLKVAETEGYIWVANGRDGNVRLDPIIPLRQEYDEGYKELGNSFYVGNEVHRVIFPWQEERARAIMRNLIVSGLFTVAVGVLLQVAVMLLVFKVISTVMKAVYSIVSGMFTWFATPQYYKGPVVQQKAPDVRFDATGGKITAKTQGRVIDDISGKISGGLFRLVVTTSTARAVEHILMITGHYGFVASHTLAHDCVSIQLQHANGTSMATLYPGQYRLFTKENDHTTVVYFPRQVPGITSLMKFLPDQDIRDKVEEVSRLVLRQTRKHVVYHEHSASVIHIFKHSFDCLEDSMTVSGMLVKFPIETRDGDCGTPYVTWTGPDHKRLGWIHVGLTSNGYAIASCISKERIQAVEAELGLVRCDARQQNSLQELPFQGDSYDGLRPYCSFKFRSPRVVTTKYSPSPFTAIDFREINTHIPLVGDNENYQKTNRFAHFYDDGLPLGLEALLYHDPEKLLKQFDHFDRTKLRELTEKECVHGVHRLGKMDKDTSVGPHFMAKGIVKRQDLIDFEKGEIVNDDLKKQVKDMYEEFSTPRYRDIVAQVKNKDEPLPLRKKVKRWYYSFDIAFLFLCRMVLGMFLALDMEFHEESPNSVGVNPHSAEWEVMLRTLLRFTNFLDGDFSKMDVTIKAYFFYIIGEWVNKIYGYEKHTREWWRITNIFKAAASPVLIIGNSGYRCMSMNASGWLFTCVVNGIAAYLSRTITGLVLVSTKTPFDWEWLLKNMYIKIFGDDSIISASTKLRKLITPEEWADAIQKYFGMTITNAAKTGPGEWYTDLKRLTFISRSFVFNKGTVLAPLEDDSFMKMMHWVKSSPNVTQKVVLQSIINTAHFEAVVKGREFYDEFTSAYLPLFRKLGFEYNPKTWDQEMELYIQNYTKDKSLFHRQRDLGTVFPDLVGEA